ncbi:MAG: zinc ribbon domain-containing protein [Clostridia bacterium]|nr:zinc ribbon domain-containing protein [Candidatus Pelethousia sp.]NCB30884.1 zinc ribbon domain-containing protein [Clostridia bacterium]
MVCPNCGKENDFGTVFCIGCGAKMPEIPSQSANGAYGETPPQQSVYPQQATSGVLGVGEFTLMELIARIPIVNLVMFCVWGFGGDANETKRNWARSRLIWLGIGVALSIIGFLIGVGLAGAVASAFSELTSYMALY